MATTIKTMASAITNSIDAPIVKAKVREMPEEQPDVVPALPPAEVDREEPAHKSFVVGEDEPLIESPKVAFISKKRLEKEVERDIKEVERINQIYKDREEIAAAEKPKQESPLRIVRPAPKKKKEIVPDTENLRKAISKIANGIGQKLEAENLYEKVRTHLKKSNKLFAGDFYKRLQNAIYNSLKEYVGIAWDSENRVDIVPDDIISSNPDQIPTMIFLDRIYNDKKVSYEKDYTLIMDRYKETYTDYLGIQEEWINALTKKLAQKLPLQQLGISTITDIIRSEWTTGVVPKKEEEVPVQTSPSQPAKHVEEHECTCGHHHDEDDESDDVENGVQVDIFINRVRENADFVKITSVDEGGQSILPIYVSLDTIDDTVPKNKNGIWGWLAYFMPQLVFETDQPEKYLRLNDKPVEENESCVRVIVLASTDDDKPIMGLYIIGYIAIHNIYEDRVESEWAMSEDNIALINNICEQYVAHDVFTPQEQITAMIKNELTEEDAVMAILNPEDNVEEIDDASEDEDANDEHPTDAEGAAIKAVLGASSIETIDGESTEEPVDLSDAEPIDSNELYPDEMAECETEEGEEFTFTPIRKK